MPNNNSTNNLFLNQNIVTTSSNYTALANDVIIEVTTTASAVTVSLPSPSVNNAGKFYIIKDISGTAATNNISIVPLSGTIDGAASLVISFNYGVAQVYSDGTNYFNQSRSPSAANAGVWLPYPSMTVNGTTFTQGTMPVTCTTTNPTKGGGTGFTDAAYYMQTGKTLTISWQFRRVTAGTAGAGGSYLFSIPTGFTINTTIAPPVPSIAGSNPWPYCYGTGRISIEAQAATYITPVTNNSTSFVLTPAQATPATGFTPIGPGLYPFSAATGIYVIGVQCIFPIN